MHVYVTRRGLSFNATTVYEKREFYNMKQYINGEYINAGEWDQIPWRNVI